MESYDRHRLTGYPGISAHKIAECTGVSLKTAKLYKSGARIPSEQTHRLIMLHLAGRVVPTWWQGVRFDKQDILWIDNGRHFNLSQLVHYRMVYSMFENSNRDAQWLYDRMNHAEEYIEYLEKLVGRAEVIRFPAQESTPTFTNRQNPYFDDASALTRPQSGRQGGEQQKQAIPVSLRQRGLIAKEVSYARG